MTFGADLTGVEIAALGFVQETPGTASGRRLKLLLSRDRAP